MLALISEIKLDRGDDYLPLFRWIESASTVRRSPGVSDWANWLVNIFLAATGWLWKLYQYIAELGQQALDFDSKFAFRDSIIGFSNNIVLTVRPFALVLAFLMVLYMLISPKKKTTEAISTAFFSAFLIIGSIAVSASGIAESLLRSGNQVLGETLDVPLDIAESTASLSFLPDTASGWGPALEDDYLSCEHLENYLLERAETEGAATLSRIMNIWAMWSFFPFWEKANYGRNAGHTASRIYCRELEAGSGRSGQEQASLALCAAGTAYAPESLDPCREGRRLFNIPSPEHPGPFTDFWVTTSPMDQTRQASAWAICLGKQSRNGGWIIHPGFAGLEIKTPDGLEEVYGDRMNLSDVFAASSVCETWFTQSSGRLSVLSRCPPWETACSEGGAHAARSISTKLLSDPQVLDTFPHKYSNWGSLAEVEEATRSYISDYNSWLGKDTLPEDETENTISELAVQEAEGWTQGRGSGGPGALEAFAVMLAFFGSLAYLPLAGGVSFGFVLSSLVVSIIIGLLPLLLLIALVPPGRKVLVQSLKYLGLAAVGWIAAITVLSVFTALLGFLAFISTELLGLAGASPQAELLIMSWLGLLPLTVWFLARFIFRYDHFRVTESHGLSPLSLEGSFHMAGSTLARRDTVQPYAQKGINVATRGYRSLKKTAKDNQATRSYKNIKAVASQNPEVKTAETLFKEDQEREASEVPKAPRNKTIQAIGTGIDIARKAKPANLLKQAEHKIAKTASKVTGKAKWADSVAETNEMGLLYANLARGAGGAYVAEKIKKVASCYQRYETAMKAISELPAEDRGNPKKALLKRIHNDLRKLPQSEQMFQEASVNAEVYYRSVVGSMLERISYEGGKTSYASIKEYLELLGDESEDPTHFGWKQFRRDYKEGTAKLKAVGSMREMALNELPDEEKQEPEQARPKPKKKTLAAEILDGLADGTTLSEKQLSDLFRTEASKRIKAINEKAKKKVLREMDVDIQNLKKLASNEKVRRSSQDGKGKRVRNYPQQLRLKREARDILDSMPQHQLGGGNTSGSIERRGS